MLRGLRLAVLSIVGFAIPIFCALELAPRVFHFKTNSPSERLAAAGYPWASSDSKTVEDPSQNQDAPSGIRSVATDADLDPKPGKYFVASVVLTMTAPPRTGKRQKFLWKYGGATKANPGWALAIRRFSTSIRPEVYWQGEDGKGGWFVFDRVRLRHNRWFALTLVAKAGEFMSMYVQEVGLPAGSDAAPAAETAQDTDDPMLADEPLFLGGYALPGVVVSPSTEPLSLAPRVFDSGDFRGSVRSLLVASPDRLPKNRDRLIGLLSGGPDEIAGRLAEGELGIWVRDDGLDHSARARVIQSEHAGAAATGANGAVTPTGAASPTGTVSGGGTQSP